MTLAPSAHPTPDRLAAFGHGKLRGPDADEVEAHVVGCEECQCALLAVPPDTLEVALRQSTVSGGAGPARADALAGAFGRYRIIKLLGKGGMATVYLAHDSELDRDVAIKVPHLRPEIGPGLVDRFRREARAAAALRHPNICPVYDVGEVGGVQYLSMAYIEGRPLADIVRPNAPLPAGRAAAIVRKVALALDHAHGRGVIHRDLKPSNVMIDAHGEPVVTDFGLARLARDGVRLTHEGAVLGTPAYMAPEQVTDSSAAGAAADVYSLGAMLYELLTGRPPFDGPVLAVLGQILNTEPPPPSRLRPDLDPALEAVCRKAMAKDAAARYRTMAEFAAALAEPHVHSTIGRGPSAAPVRNRRRVWAAAAVAGLAAAAAGLWMYVAPRGQRPSGWLPEIAKADVPVGEVRQFTGHQSLVMGVAFAPDGKRFVSGSLDRKIILWDVETGKPVRSWTGNAEGVECVAFSADGNFILSGGGKEKKSGGKDFDLRLWEADTGQEVRRFKGHTDGVRSVTISRDGRFALSGGEDHTVRYWNVDSGEQVYCLQAHPFVPYRAAAGGLIGARDYYAVRGVAFSPDGRRAVSVGLGDAGVVLWNLETGQWIRSLTGHSNSVLSAAFCLDGKHVVSGSYDTDLIRWDLSTGKGHRLSGHQSNVWCVAVSSDGRRALSGASSHLFLGNGASRKAEEETVRLWDLSVGKHIRGFAGHPEWIRSVAISPDGRFALSAGDNPVIRLWRLPDP